MTAAERLDVAHDVGHDHRDSGQLVTVTMPLADAVAISQTLRSHGRDRRTPTGARDILTRVGNQWWAACRAAIAAAKADRDTRRDDIVDRLRSMGGV